MSNAFAFLILGWGLISFVLGIWVGRREERRERAREIEAGREYLAALDEAVKGVRGGTRLSVGILVERQEQPAREGRAHLRVVTVGEEVEEVS